MRVNLVIAALALGLSVGCSSTANKTETKMDKAEAAVAGAKKDAAAAVKDAKAEVKKAGQEAQAAASDSKAECESKGDARTLEVRAKEKGCELGYTKGGQETIVATSQNGKAHCAATLNKIKERLVAAGFSCK